MKKQPKFRCLWIGAIAFVVISGCFTAIYFANVVQSQIRSNVIAAKITYSLGEYTSYYGQLPKSRALECEHRLSWRTQIERNSLSINGIAFDYDTCRPWNSIENVTASKIKTFAFNPLEASETDLPTTNFFVISGAATAFPENLNVKILDIKDGTENTVLVIEDVSFTIPWTKPEDLQLSNSQILQNGEVILRDPILLPGSHLIFADFKCCKVLKPIPNSLLIPMLTIDGEEPVFRAELIYEGFLEIP